MCLKLPGASSVLPDAKVFKSCSRCPSHSESLSSGSLYLLSIGGQGPEVGVGESLKSSSLVLLVERPRTEVGVGGSLKSSFLVLLVERVGVGESLKSSFLVLLVERPGPEVRVGESLKSSSLVLLVERPRTEVGVGGSLKSSFLVLLVERPRPEVGVGESLKSSFLVLLVERPGPEVRVGESLKSSSLILLVERPRTEVGVGESLKSFSLVLLVERPRPEVGVGESLKSSSLHASSQVLLVEKPRPDVDGGAEDIPLAVQNRPEGQRRKGEMPAKKSLVGAARQEGAPWGSRGIREARARCGECRVAGVLFPDPLRGEDEAWCCWSEQDVPVAEKKPPEGQLPKGRSRDIQGEAWSEVPTHCLPKMYRWELLGERGEMSDIGITVITVTTIIFSVLFLLFHVPDLTYLFLIRSVVDKEITFIACRTIHDEVLRSCGGGLS
ncbi:hypothetical protein F7725_000258 [Dissostichus mawsoni]|uniref:Uncharacterized protein n=1 Tax=Dissostichus mawsoni TaxID=36200 RepID=A0A7J5ZEH7_DISMA|nr:hypothetical protein F7725_000258 [Dissostichus mawsoni]